jgi:uncharacterized membrane protein YfcA
VSHEQLCWLTAAIALVAFLYSSVGHAGASGYIAVMSLFGLAPIVIKPTALVLNICVAAIAAFQFWRAGHFSWRLFWPFALLSVPCAFVGGWLNLPAHLFKILVGLVLLFSAARFSLQPSADAVRSTPSRSAALTSGAALGFLAGLTGTGGGIFLTPLLLLMRWAKTKTAAAVSAMFILVNSIAGLAGNIGSTKQFPFFGLYLVIAALVAGTAGAYLGSGAFSHTTIRRLLAAVLLIAGLKLIFT